MDDLMSKIKAEFKVQIEAKLDEKSVMNLTFLHIIYKRVESKRYIMRRGIYYESPNIFKTQRTVERIIQRYIKNLNCREEDMMIRPGLKGIYKGKLVFKMKQICEAEPERGKEEKKQLIPDMMFVEEVTTPHQSILIVEKDTVVDEIMGVDALIVCGKGYPCKNTCTLLQRLESHVKKIYCLTDYDPDGLQIYLKYKEAVERVKRIGIGYRDIQKYMVQESDCILLSERDKKMLNRLKSTEVSEEAEFLIGFGYKLELESILKETRYKVEI